jgi:hypothetical protein
MSSHNRGHAIFLSRQPLIILAQNYTLSALRNINHFQTSTNQYLVSNEYFYMVNPCCDVTKTTVNKIKKLSKMADITSSENISRSKQDMKNREKKLIYSFKISFKWENKNLYCHFPLIKKTCVSRRWNLLRGSIANSRP